MRRRCCGEEREGGGKRWKEVDGGVGKVERGWLRERLTLVGFLAGRRASLLDFLGDLVAEISVGCRGSGSLLMNDKGEVKRGGGRGMQSRGRWGRDRSGTGREGGEYLMDCILRIVELEMWMGGLKMRFCFGDCWGRSDTYVKGRGKRLLMNAALVDGKGM